ncbi:uncharacterized protein JCM15063_002086 [Sporobolomyces koalae]|uniref:uncharacterized protein n=1 Tax=Sporobolomyces koalae TaxID=500713 RepID=UPI0031776D7A
MDGAAIYDAIVQHAITAPLVPIPISTHLYQAAPDVGSSLADGKGEHIYRALVTAATAVARSAATTSELEASHAHSPLLPDKVIVLATAENQSYPGFLTARLAGLPSAASIVLGVLLILLGLACLVFGARSLYVGRDLGRTYGTDERKGWLRGGVGGIFFGSVALGMVASTLILLVVSKQRSSSLGSWSVLVIIVLAALLGAVAGGRWSWCSRSSLALVSGIGIALLVIVSAHIKRVLTRLILTAVFVTLSEIAANVYLCQKFALPAFVAMSGSFVLVLGIDVFSRVGFHDVLGLLMKPLGVGARGGEAQEFVVDWSGRRGKGLIAAWWILSIASGVWQGWWGLGIEGQETWDNYLDHHLPIGSGLGRHLPPLTVIDKIRSLVPIRGKRQDCDRNEFIQRQRTPWDDDDHEEETRDEFDLDKIKHDSVFADPWDPNVDDTLTVLPKAKSRPRLACRKTSSRPARYGVVGEADSSDDEEDEYDLKGDLGVHDPYDVRADADSTRSFGALSGSTFVSDRNRLEIEKARTERRIAKEQGDDVPRPGRLNRLAHRDSDSQMPSSPTRTAIETDFADGTATNDTKTKRGWRITNPFSRASTSFAAFDH